MILRDTSYGHSRADVFVKREVNSKSTKIFKQFRQTDEAHWDRMLRESDEKKAKQKLASLLIVAPVGKEVFVWCPLFTREEAFSSNDLRLEHELGADAQDSKYLHRLPPFRIKRCLCAHAE